MPELIVASTKTRHQTFFPFPVFTPQLRHVPTHSLPFFFFEIFFITLPLHLLLLFFSLLFVYSTWAQVSAGTLQPSTTGQGQFLSIVVVQVRRYDYASFTMSPRHAILLFHPTPGFMTLSVSVSLIMYFYHLSRSPAPAIPIVLSLSVSMHVYSLFYLAL